MKYVIFYSWQSDLPNNTNRGLLQNAIENAISEINKSDTFDIEVSFDRDTLGIPGAPNIVETLLEKIKQADAFIADISIVTGGPPSTQRSSPNPNVLLELGYAIALKGWERIILLYNEKYGADQDLPFDIRQHRRISYRLKEDDPKAETRKILSAQIKSRLIEIIEHNKDKEIEKNPFIAPSWSIWPTHSGDEDEGQASSTLPLAETLEITAVIDSVRQDLEEIYHIDGSIDPQWGGKVYKFRQEVERFILGLQEKVNADAYFIIRNFARSTRGTLAASNIGTATATDVRIEIQLPEWLVAFEDVPEIKLEKPVRPTPTPPPRATTLGSSIFGNIVTRNIIPPSFDQVLRATRTSGCKLNCSKHVISFWADRILHKHFASAEFDKYYFLAQPAAPKGEHTLKGKAFCSEYDDWQEVSLVVHVK